MNINKFMAFLLPLFLLHICSCSNEATSEVETKYSPIALYFDPLMYSDAFSYSHLYPLFVNYPNDWTKCGLRDHPSVVLCKKHKGGFYNVDYTLNVYFNAAGNLSDKAVFDFNQKDTYRYDADFEKIEEITAYDSWSGGNKQYPAPQYEGELINSWDLRQIGGGGAIRDGYSHVRGYKFVYYPDKTLKELVPDADSYLYQKSTLGQFFFNEKGQLEKTIVPLTDNRLLKKAKNNNTEMPSECTFEYGDDGLCTAKNEKVFYKYGDNPVDTLKCRYSYYYNSQGDLKKLEFDGDVYVSLNGNEYTFRHSSFSIDYEYIYDAKRNWTKMFMIMPDGFEENPELYKYWEMQKSENPYFDSGSKLDRTRTVMYLRDIPDYYEKSLKELKEDLTRAKEKELEEEKNKKPDITAVECRGLYGKVKSLKTDSEIVNFNIIGNVESTNNFTYGGGEVIYYYETPFKYGFQEGEYPMEIKIDNNARIESHTEYDESEEFEFDDKHRLIRHFFLEGMSPVTHYFSYHGNDRFPESLSYEYYDETGSGNVHVRYTYLDVDKHGNWLRRKCNVTGTSISYEGDENEIETKEPIGPYEEIETRQLLYY